MRKYSILGMVFLLTGILLSGCTGRQMTAAGAGDAAERGDVKTEADTARTDSPVDVDLTAMSSTMVYAEVYNIMAHPEEYLGKTIKMRGPYAPSFFEETGLYYHFVMVEDAAACCQQGIEFIWNGDHSYPDDYPQEKEEIEVAGIFSTYEELGFDYYYLAIGEIDIM